MRVLLRASIPVDAGNKAVKDGSIGRIIGEFSEKAKPECSYFTLRGGKRTMYAVFDLKDVSNLPSIVEPLFSGLNASVDYSPCMNSDDLQKGLKQLGGK
ncbi:MAG: hypothetical protein IT462_16090 [Planctomycetes bacterium]|nr:hypothetical protein [Planctomycetota bacterium]